MEDACQRGVGKRASVFERGEVEKKKRRRKMVRLEAHEAKGQR